MESKIDFPALKFIGNQIMVVPINSGGHLIGDENMANYYFPTEIVIIDSKGNCFEFKKVKAFGRVQIIPSIKYIGLMYRLRPILTNPVSKISLDDFKSKVLEFSSKKQKSMGLFKDELKSIQNAVKSAANHNAVIEIIDAVSYWK